MDKILIITYLFAVGETRYERIIEETSDENVTTSPNTVADWMSYCREITYDWSQKYQEKELIGGEGN